MKKRKKSSKIKIISKVLMFILFVGIVTYSVFPSEMTKREWEFYSRSYGVTLGLTLGGGLIGITLGTFLAYLRFQKVRVVEFIIDEYIDIMRGTPMVLQLLIFSVVVGLPQYVLSSLD